MATTTINKSLPNGFAFASGEANDTVFTFTNEMLNTWSIATGFFWGSVGPTLGFLYMFYVINDEITIQQIYNASDRTFTATVSGHTITITASATIWGGLRFFALNGNN